MSNNNSIKFNKTIAALVFDRFYGSGANALRVIIQRIITAVAISVLGIGYVFSMYSLPVSIGGLSVISGIAALVFSLLFSVVRRRFAIPFLTAVSGIVILASLKKFWEKFSFFVDGFILEFNGRILDTSSSTIHPSKLIERYGQFTQSYIDGAVFGSVILCIVFALITAAGVIGKPHILPSLTAFILLCAPKLVSEQLRFRWQLIPLIALYAGVLAIGSYYRDGLAIRHVYAAGGYRRKVAMDDRRFNVAVRSQSLGQKAASRGLHYSKYFSSVMSAAAIFVTVGIIVSAVCRNSTGIDYEPFYEALMNIGSGFGSSNDSPFKTGVEGDYFTSPSTSVFKTNNRLRLTSPSTGTREIIRVTKDICKKPLYLRGDIGIDFDGESWSTPVIDEPQEWLSSGLCTYMLPIEVITLAENIDIANGTTFQVGSYFNASVEYMCDTDVIFAPAYNYGFNLFDPMYGRENLGTVIYRYGDYTFRRADEKAKGETMNFVAAVPYYTDASNDWDASVFSMALSAYKNGSISNNNFNSINNMLTDANIDIGRGYFRSDYSKYVKYVKNQYLGVPNNMKADLDAFIESSGLNELRESTKLKYMVSLGGSITGNFVIGSITTDINGNIISSTLEGEWDEVSDRFVSAVVVSDYLKSNYTYSLNANVDKRNPVMSFLNDTKSGHCALYASAMTLILREWGIPARYCTGFAANADLSMVTLRSKDLHAWVEVYLDGLGWVTFDPTAAAFFDSRDDSESSPESSVPNSNSSSAQSSSAPSSSSDSSSSSHSSAVSSSSASSDSNSSDGFTHDSSSDAEPGQSITFAQVLPYILTILGILAVIAVIVLAVMAYNRLKQRAYKRVQSFHRLRNSEYVYEMLLAVLRFCKLKPESGEQPHIFFDRAETVLNCGICDNYALLERLAFGNADFDETERALLGRTFDRVYKAAEQRFKLIGLIRLRLLVLKRKV